MYVNIPVDVEEFLSVETATFSGYTTACPPLNPSISNVPYVGFTRIGGSEGTEVSSIHSVSVDVWALSDAEALETAAKVAGVIRAFPHAETTKQVLEANYSAPPYLNPDTNNPAMKRASFTVNIHMRDEQENI